MLIPLLAALTLQAPQPMRISPEGLKAMDPQVAVSHGRVAVAYGSADNIYVTTSNFHTTLKLPVPGHLALGMHRGPRIAFSRGAIVVTAIYGTQGKGADGDLYAWRATGRDLHWSGPYRVTDTPGAAREGLHGLAVSRTGELASVWLDLRNHGTEVWSSTSEDGGLTWSANTQVYRSPDGHVCECCHTSAAFAPNGDLYVMFRNWLGGARDLYVAASKDNGKSFAPPQKLGLGTWFLNACPMDGGSISVSSSGTVRTAWRREDAVYTCIAGEPETKVGNGTQIWQSQNGWSVWQAGSDILARHRNDPQITLSHDGTRPSVASDGDTTIAAWSDSTGAAWAVKLPNH